MKKLFSGFIKKLISFEYEFETDPYWNIIFSNGKRKWYYLIVSYYNEIYYLSELIHHTGSLEIHKSVQRQQGKHPVHLLNPDDVHWEEIIRLAENHLQKVKNNWIKEYGYLQKNYPYTYRKGIVYGKIARKYCEDIVRIDKALGANKLNQFISKAESNELASGKLGVVKDLTSGKFFEYCKVAYLNSDLKLDNKTKLLPGKELYKIFADGRHEGLLDINQNSIKEFKAWMNGTHPKKTSGGHPWEILRGGNTTNISLYVSNYSFSGKNEYELKLYGNSINRIAETLKIYLALLANNRPVKIDEPLQIRKRLLGQDYIGIVPEYSSLHRAEQLFDTPINDSIHLSFFGRNKNKIIALATWEQLPCLKPI